MPPKKAPADYLREWREYKALHGSRPVESLGSAGYALAVSIRRARATGKFTATELAELDATPLPRATGPRGKEEGSPKSRTLGGSTASGFSITEPTVSLPPAAAKTHTPPATGPEGEAVASATGQAAGGATASSAGPCTTLSLPGLNINWPFSQLMLAGVKTVEARSYTLGYRSIAQPGVDMWLVETPGQANVLSKGWVLAGDAQVAPRPANAHIVGTVTFAYSAEYESLAAFQADRKNHRIAEGSSYDWRGNGEMHAWHVSAVRRLAQPVPQPGRKGVTGFTRHRSYTVTIAEPGKDGAVPCTRPSAAAPSSSCSNCHGLCITHACRPPGGVRRSWQRPHSSAHEPTGHRPCSRTDTRHRPCSDPGRWSCSVSCCEGHRPGDFGFVREGRP